MMALRLIGIEWFKASRRAAFRVSVAAFAGVFVLLLGITQYRFATARSDRAFSLPASWLDLIRGPGGLAVLLVTVVVVLLVASERSWRTQRQNVIDGLSRGQFFSAKLLLALLVVVIFWAITPLMGVVFAAFDGAPGYTDGTGPLLPASVVSVLGGYFVHLVGTAAIAFMFGIVASGSGAALAFTFIFLVGQAPIVALLPRQDEFWVEVARRAPVNVFDHLTNPVIYDAARLAEMNRSREGIERLLSGFEANALALGYSAVFIGIAWLAFRRRDL